MLEAYSGDTNISRNGREWTMDLCNLAKNRSNLISKPSLGSADVNSITIKGEIVVIAGHSKRSDYRTRPRVSFRMPSFDTDAYGFPSGGKDTE
jgi:hypothetical protein